MNSCLKIVQLKGIYVHLVLRKIFVALVWKEQQSLFLHHFHIIILPILFRVRQISIHVFIIELQYNHVFYLMTLNCILY